MTSKLATIAHSHLGESGPTDSCLHAINRWVVEAGGVSIGTDSVTAAQAAAEQHHAGWAYHAGLDGVQVGDVLDWDPKALGRPTDRHVSVLYERQGTMFKSIGSGGPSGKVAYQPQGGGFNPASTFRGYFRPALSKPAAPAPAKTAPAASSSTDYVVRAGDDLIRIAAAHGTTVARLLALNPPAANHRTQNYSILHANLILVGQRLRLR